MKISLRRCLAQTVKIGASSHKRNYIDILSEILNPEELHNRCIGSKVTAILLNRLRNFLLISLLVPAAKYDLYPQLFLIIILYCWLCHSFCNETVH